MNRLKILALVFAFAGASLRSQAIQMDFPHFSGKTYDFIIFQGDLQKKIIQGTIPPNGKFTLRIPEKYSPYTGMSRWLITNSKEGGGLDMVIPGHDFSVSCLEAKPDESNIIYSGNSQMAELNTLHRQQETILGKYQSMLQVLNSFPKDDKNYPVFQQRLREQENLFASFQNQLNIIPDYAKGFLRIVNITRGIGTELSDAEEKKARSIVSYIAGMMKWNDLYTSGHWSTVISSWIYLYTQVLKDNHSFVSDFARITSGIKDHDVYADFTGRVSHALTQQGQDTLINVIAPYVISSGKIDKYEGFLLAYTKGAAGTKAPDLVITDMGKVKNHTQRLTTLKSSELAGKEYQYTLITFYKSGCGSCESLLHELTEKHKDLIYKKVRVISLSADTDPDTFEKRSRYFPWQESYCDYEGMNGLNFKNYGIFGTPTLILIDTSGKILLKTASLEKVMEEL